MAADHATQLEQLQALLTQFGAGFKVKSGEDSPDPDVTAIRIREGYVGEAGRVDGYVRFYCDFLFDEHGMFVSVGCWE